MGRATPYRDLRNYENLQKGMYWGAGEYDIPVLMPVTECDVDQWLSFNFFKGCANPGKTGLHFFLDDYQFERVWKQPDTYLPVFQRFGAVCTPDFSPYADFPKIIQLYNHYRKHWCGAYWQERGVKVIPTITWSSPDTLEWCFDGEPVGGIVATSAVGMFDTSEHLLWLIDGVKEMLNRLKPTKIIWKGRVPDEFADLQESGLICTIGSHVDKWRALEAEKERKRA